MKARFNMKAAEPRTYEAMAVADKQIDAFDLDPRIRELVRIRASQINGCGYCINMHSEDARKLGEAERRLYAVSAWWETPFFSEEERIALKLTEEITRISEHGVSDETFAGAVKTFGEKKVAQLIFLIVTINSWNRIAISLHLVAGRD
jgi:AhpD family alkylhydroperoxidase